MAALVVLFADAGLFAALPWVLGWSCARQLLAARANAILAPSSVEFAAIRFSWFGPTEIRDVVLRDAQGDRLVAAPRAVFDWNLWQIVFARPRSATLRVLQGDLQIERAADGTVDLYQTLEPIIRAHPQRRLVITVERGRLCFRDPAFAEPVVADEADIVLDLPVDPQPITWTVRLARTGLIGAPGRLELTGSSQRSAAVPGEAQIALRASRWPWALAAAGVEAHGSLDGTLDAHRQSARWRLVGDAQISHLAATVARVPSRSVRLETVRAAWEVEGDADRWTSQRLELSLPLAAMAGDGSSPRRDEGGAWRDGDLGLSAKVGYEPRSDRVAISELVLTAPCGRLSGSGHIDRATTRPRLDLAGSLEPDWPALQAMLVRAVEPNARIAGRPRGWRLAGTIGDASGDETADKLGGELGLQIDTLDLFGMRLAQTSVVLRAADGRLSFDPIDARLNEGRLHLEPQWIQEGEGPFRLRLGSSSTLENAIVNDEVSHRVLAYAAPILDGATRVEGRVSVQRLDAEFPILAPAGTPARVEGDVLFDEVRFLPGPLAEDLLSLLPDRGSQPMLVLRNPISLRIAEGKVYQRGLVIPLGQVATVGLEGSVAFDKRLDLVARFTLNPPRADMPVLSSVLRTAQFELPIRGTLKQPKIDQLALKERLKSLGSDLLENSVASGAAGLLRLLEGLPARRQARTPPPGPPQADQPGSPSPEDRRHRREARRLERIEKKAERRARRGLPPDDD